MDIRKTIHDQYVRDLGERYLSMNEAEKQAVEEETEKLYQAVLRGIAARRGKKLIDVTLGEFMDEFIPALVEHLGSLH
jgi:hypothetical protein